jgi:phosphoglycerate dehydrogenase-like enzyme
MKVAILDDYQDVAKRLADWQGIRPSCDVKSFTSFIDDASKLAECLADFEIIVAMRERTRFPADLLAALPALKLLVTTGPSNAAIDVAAAQRLGIVVSGTDSIGHPTAELTWGLILAFLRHIPTEDRSMREGGWQTTIGTGLRGKQLGIIGLGRIGSQVAEVARAFGMQVVAWTPKLTEERAAEAGCRAVSLDTLLGTADIVSIHARLTVENRGLIGAEQFKRMKAGALLVNAARGPIVDESALIDALAAGRIGGYAADVYENEPLRRDHPLRKAPNTLLTPHIGYVTEETYRIFYGQAVEDIQSFLEGKPIRVVRA